MWEGAPGECVPGAPPASLLFADLSRSDVRYAWLSLNVHHRVAEAENRLLAGTLAPLLRRMEADGAVRAVWGTRFDARGPHLFLLVGAAPGAEEEVEMALRESVRRHLRLHPAGEVFTPQELAERHRQCRGSGFWRADRRPGIAPPDSFEAGAPEPDDFPHPLVRGMDAAAEEAYWGASTRLFHRAAARVAEGAATPAAVGWVAAVDRALRVHGMAEAAWSHHASSLVLPLAERLRQEREAVLATLHGAVTPRNRALFERLWEERDEALERCAAALVAAALAPDARSPALRLYAVRTAVHGATLLLGLPASAELPLVLHAWARSLPPAEVA